MMNGIGNALSFLTILPVPVRFTAVDGFARCSRWFPLAGLVLGALLAAAAWLLGGWLPAAVGGALLTALWAVLTGGLHLDGLADTADGLGVARARERALEIMKDSRIGAMGAAALILHLLIKALACGAILQSGGILIFLFAPAAGRAALLLLPALLPPARPDGLGAATAQDNNQQIMILWWVALLMVGVSFGGWLCAGAVFAGLLAAGGFAFMIRRRLGGYTGDILGAACELTELAVLIIASVR